MIQKIELQFIAMFTLLSKLRDLLRDFSPLSRGFSPGIKKCRNRPKLSSNNKLIIQKIELQFIASFTLLSRLRDLSRGFSPLPRGFSPGTKKPETYGLYSHLNLSRY